jgi:hypothetical protein
MATEVHITGTYKEKIEIFGIVVAHHKGNFDVTKPIGDVTWSQHFGPVTITEAVSGGEATISLSAFGQSTAIFKKGVTGTNKFKIEIDRGNEVDGQITVQ